MKYDAFISYRHAELDLYIAKKVHKGLETLKVPKAVAKKTGKKKISRVFRDQEELPIGSDLGDNIESALEQSEYLLVICSPRTPDSYWVQKEISTFIQMHGREHILAVLIEGEPDQAFPKLLLTDDEGNPVEPLAADVRGTSKREINKKLKTEILRLAAPLLGCSYDDLKQRHKERQMKRVAAGAATVAALALLFGAYSTYNAALIQQNYEGKQRNQSKYLAETSLELLAAGDRRAAVLVALEALPSKEEDKPYVAEAQYALSQALYCYDTGIDLKMDRLLQHDLPVRDFYCNAEGNRIVSIDQGYSVYVWEIEGGRKLAQIAPEVDQSGYIIDVDSAMIYEDSVIICAGNKLRSVTFDGQEEWSIESKEGILDCEFDEETHMAVCIGTEEVIFYDYTNGEKIGTMPNQIECGYTNNVALSKDRSKVAVAHLLWNDEGSNYVSVYDFKAGQVTDIEVTGTYVADVAFTWENDLLVALSGEVDLINYSETTSVGQIQKIDVDTGQILWQDTYEYLAIGDETANEVIKYRKYEDEITGEVYDEVIMSVDNKAFTWNGKTGERTAQIIVDDGIKEVFVTADSCYGYLAQDSGKIDFVNLTKGEVYSVGMIETGRSITNVKLGNGRVVFCSYTSPDLGIMECPDASDATVVAEFGKGISQVVSSKKETYYAVETFGDVDTTYFYETESYKMVGRWEEEAGANVQISGFVDDDTYMKGCMDENLLFYDIKSKEKETLFIGDEFHISSYSINKEGNIIFAYDGSDYAVVDLQSRQVLQIGNLGQYIYHVVVSPDGKKAYCDVGEAGIYILDTATGEVTLIELPEYQVLNSADSSGALELSEDGKLLAVSCRDGKLRVLDIEKQKTAAEIPFTGVNRRFVEFCKEDTQIMFQGDDYYFCVYDLEKQEFIYISANQYSQIQATLTDEKHGILCLTTDNDMLILNLEDYERIAQVEGGELFLQEKGSILSVQYNVLYRFPYMTLEMLREEAREQFGNEELTALERTKYHVD